jgi:predicted dehydrogenase
MARLRIGVVGCGLIAQVMHLHYLRELSDLFEVAGICDLSPGTLRAVGDAHGIDWRTTEVEELASGHVDALLVANSGSHVGPALAALAQGKPVFVEKPLAPTVAEADRVLAAQERAGLPGQVGYMKRHDPGYRRALELLQPMLATLRLAQLTTLEGPETHYTAQYPVHRVADAPPARLAQLAEERDAALQRTFGHVDDELRRGYGINLIETCVHDVNAMRGALGDPLSVRAMRWAAGDAWSALFTYPGELRAHFDWAFLPDLPEYTERHAYHGPDQRLEMVFPSPFLRHEPTLVLRWTAGPQGGTALNARTYSEERVSHQEAFAQELRHFHAYVHGKVECLTPFSQGREDLAWLEAMWRSSETGKEEAADLGTAAAVAS